MARRNPPTFSCDATGCRSTCTLLPVDPPRSLVTELVARGWLVEGSDDEDEGDRHFCPGCRDKVTSPTEPTDTE